MLVYSLVFGLSLIVLLWSAGRFQVTRPKRRARRLRQILTKLIDGLDEDLLPTMPWWPDAAQTLVSEGFKSDQAMLTNLRQAVAKLDAAARAGRLVGGDLAVAGEAIVAGLEYSESRRMKVETVIDCLRDHTVNRVAEMTEGFVSVLAAAEKLGVVSSAESNQFRSTVQRFMEYRRRMGVTPPAADIIERLLFLDWLVMTGDTLVTRIEAEEALGEDIGDTMTGADGDANPDGSSAWGDEPADENGEPPEPPKKTVH
jgi:hypothetical protein